MHKFLIEFLESLLDGTMKRADIERAAKASRSPKTIKLSLNVGGIDIRLSSIPANADYDCLVELLGQVKAKFLMQKRQVYRRQCSTCLRLHLGS